MITGNPVEACPYRSDVRVEGPIEDASCAILREVVGAVEAGFSRVRRDACEYCRRSNHPESSEINPVLASLLHGTARKVLDLGGVEGCSADHAASLLRRAEDLLDDDPAEVDDPYRPPRSARPCHYLGSPIGRRRVRSRGRIEPIVVSRCHHPDHRETTEPECDRCLDWTDRAGPGRDPSGRHLPVPLARSGPDVRTWSVGVTTSPRRRPTLEWTLDGLARAGWDRPRLFVDGPATIPSKHADCPVTHREPKSGAWPNFYLGLAELTLRDPEVDAYLMVQDDVAFFDGVRLRDYLESILWPGEVPGPVSLYSCQLNTRPTFGWSKHEAPWFLGAHAFLFPPESARRFLADPDVIAHRRSRTNNGLANVDTIVGRWAFRSGTPITFPTPSLCRHVGHTSTLWARARIEGNRKEGVFAGDLAPPSIAPGDFDEARFPCEDGPVEAYRAIVDRGIDRMRGSSVVICGVCRDLLPDLPEFAARVERLGAMFGEYRAVFFESDSVDGTAAFLQAWSASNPAVTAISGRRRVARFPQVAGPERAAHLASCRNVYREYIRSHLAHFDHAIVVDADTVGGWSFEGVAHTFGHDDWDFMGSNGLITPPSRAGRPVYFDTWAHVEEAEGGASVVDLGKLDFRRGQPPRPVLSCFGGLGVYRMDCLTAAYEGDACEHVALHRNMRAMGFDRLFLNPSQIVVHNRSR